MNRPLTLDDVPEDLLTEYGLQRGTGTEPTYRCADSAARVAALFGPRRGRATGRASLRRHGLPQAIPNPEIVSASGVRERAIGSNEEALRSADHRRKEAGL